MARIGNNKTKSITKSIYILASIQTAACLTLHWSHLLASVHFISKTPIRLSFTGANKYEDMQYNHCATRTSLYSPDASRQDGRGSKVATTPKHVPLCWIFEYLPPVRAKTCRCSARGISMRPRGRVLSATRAARESTLAAYQAASLPRGLCIPLTVRKTRSHRLKRPSAALETRDAAKVSSSWAAAAANLACWMETLWVYKANTGKRSEPSVAGSLSGAAQC